MNQQANFISYEVSKWPHQSSIYCSIKKEVDPNNSRPIKSSESYYLLKCTNVPSIIVECGFLTNPEEEKLLNSPEYQDKMAYAISEGITQFLDASSNEQPTAETNQQFEEIVEEIFTKDATPTMGGRLLCYFVLFCVI